MGMMHQQRAKIAETPRENYRRKTHMSCGKCGKKAKKKVAKKATKKKAVKKKKK